MGEYKDRGMIKWQGLMLTEHISKLREWEAEENYTDRPMLDEFELAAISEEIELAYKSKMTIKLKCWRDGQIHTDYGVPIEINMTNKILVIEDPFSTNRYSFDDIIAASLIIE